MAGQALVLAVVAGGAVSSRKRTALLLSGRPGAFRAQTSSRGARAVASAADDLREDLEAKLRDAVEREDYKAAAELKAQLDAAPVPVGKLYASLQKRASELASRREAITRERELVKNLAGVWPKCELAQRSLWEHWFGEYGEEAREELVTADGEAAQLLSLTEKYPDWVEPANRLATLRYVEGDYAASVSLCLKILRNKPWHFGASSGIVMCYVKLGDTESANEWAAEAMPQLGPKREKWVERMVNAIDAKLAELDVIDGDLF